MSIIFSPPPPPASRLARYRMLSPLANVKVSPLCLGAMSIGTAWEKEPLISGGMTKEESFAFLDKFYKLGGNFIDTANNYHFGQSEDFIGEWMEKRGIRDEMVIATKFTSPIPSFEDKHIKINSAGNSKKSLHVAVKESLKRLRTDYIDILYLHWWDHTGNIEQIMNFLHEIVQSGKVLYLGISDTPAWVVSRANAYARAHALTPFVVYQGQWSLILRDLEREILPMCRAEGMAIAPWGALGQGRIRTVKQVEEREKEFGSAVRGGGQSDDERKLAEAIEQIQNEVGAGSISQVLLAWIMSKYEYCYPIIGGTKERYLDDNEAALGVQLNAAQIEKLESILPFNFGFPTTMIGHDAHLTGKTGFVLHHHAGVIDYVVNQGHLPQPLQDPK